MPRVRVYVDSSSRGVLQVEHRLDEEYRADNASLSGPGVSTAIIDMPIEGAIVNVPFSELEVRDDAIVRRDGRVLGEMNVSRVDAAGMQIVVHPPDDAAQRRTAEIRQVDKSTLGDDEWLKLYREYITLSGQF
jgi:hypothetical protein